MSQDELAVMDGGKCILQLRGVRPFLSDKYDITKHPNDIVNIGLHFFHKDVRLYAASCSEV